MSEQVSINLQQFKKLAADYNVIPLSTTAILDLDTPVGIYLKSGAFKMPYSFLLESVTGGDSRGRYSILGLDSAGIVKGKDASFAFTRDGQSTPLKAKDPIAALEEVTSRYSFYDDTELSGFVAGAVGFFAYDIIRYYERINLTNSFSDNGRANSHLPDPVQIEDMVYTLPRQIVWIDHARGTMRIIENAFIDEGDDLDQLYEQTVENIAKLQLSIRSGTGLAEFNDLAKPAGTPVKKWQCNTSEEEYASMVEKARDYMIAGDIFQVVLAKRFFQDYDHHPFWLYRALRATNPSPYMFYLNFPEGQLVGSSPEILVKKKKDEVVVRPIAGTIQRGRDGEEDEKLGAQLLADEKERAEHLMLVDLGRNDVGRISDPGTVEVTEFMVIEKYSHVQHIVSHVIGKLQSRYNSYSALWATLPAGTVSGAPKVRAMQIIEELEKEVRGTYAGCIGYFSLDGDMDSAIALRTMLVKGSTLYVQAGAGLVYDSDPAKENEECRRKAAALFRAVELLYEGAIE